MYKSKTNSMLIIGLTFLSLFPILFVRLRDFQTSIFWLYSILMTFFLIFMYFYTNIYKPTPDLGFRPVVSCIIPVKNEEEIIQKTITSVLESDYPKNKLEVVVIDDGSTDQTVSKILEINSNRLTFIKHKKNYGKRIALASGFKIAKGDIIICIDSDSIVEKNAIKLLVQPLKNKNVVAVCGHGEAINKDKNFLTKLQHFWYQEMFRIMKGMESKFGSVTCCSGILAAYRKSSILPVMKEWLNEKFLGKPILIGDDRQLTNLVLRGLSDYLSKSQADDRTLTANALSTKEAKVVYQSNAIVYTLVPDKFMQFLKQQLRWKRAWVHGSLLAGKFMYKKPFPTPIYFYLYQFLTYLNPVVVFVWIVIKPFNGEYIGSIAFISGAFYTAFLHGLNLYKYNGYGSESIRYRILFVFMSVFLSIFLLPYAWLTVHKGGWVTRSNKI